MSGNEKKPFLYFSTGKPPISILSSDYKLYDSLKVFSASDDLITTFKKEVCGINNILCLKYYTKTKEEIVKNGTKNIDYEITLK